LIPGEYQLNPPFSESFILMVLYKLEQCLTTHFPYSFLIVLPDWSSPPITYLEEMNERFGVLEFLITPEKGMYKSYQRGQQQYFKPVFSSRHMVFQNARGREEYPLATYESDVRLLLSEHADQNI